MTSSEQSDSPFFREGAPPPDLIDDLPHSTSLDAKPEQSESRPQANFTDPNEHALARELQRAGAEQSDSGNLSAGDRVQIGGRSFWAGRLGIIDRFERLPYSVLVAIDNEPGIFALRSRRADEVSLMSHSDSARASLRFRFYEEVTGWMLVRMAKIAAKRGDVHELRHIAAQMEIGESVDCAHVER